MALPPAWVEKFYAPSFSKRVSSFFIDTSIIVSLGSIATGSTPIKTNFILISMFWDAWLGRPFLVKYDYFFIYFTFAFLLILVQLYFLNKTLGQLILGLHNVFNFKNIKSLAFFSFGTTFLPWLTLGLSNSIALIHPERKTLSEILSNVRVCVIKKSLGNENAFFKKIRGTLFGFNILFFIFAMFFIFSHMTWTKNGWLLGGSSWDRKEWLSEASKYSHLEKIQNDTPKKAYQRILEAIKTKDEKALLYLATEESKLFLKAAPKEVLFNLFQPQLNLMSIKLNKSKTHAKLIFESNSGDSAIQTWILAQDDEVWKLDLLRTFKEVHLQIPSTKED